MASIYESFNTESLNARATHFKQDIVNSRYCKFSVVTNGYIFM